MNQYTPIYHEACRHLINYGGHGGDTVKGRQLIAKALRVIRNRHGNERALWERRHMLFISGMFPIKKV